MTVHEMAKIFKPLTLGDKAELLAAICRAYENCLADPTCPPETLEGLGVIKDALLECIG